MWASWRHQESTWVFALLHDRELECLNDKFSFVLVLFLRTYLMEFISVKQGPGKTLSFSDTVPGDVICAFTTTYKPAVVEVRTVHTGGSLLGAQAINISTSYNYGSKQHKSYM